MVTVEEPSTRQASFGLEGGEGPNWLVFTQKHSSNWQKWWPGTDGGGGRDKTGSVTSVLGPRDWITCSKRDIVFKMLIWVFPAAQTVSGGGRAQVAGMLPPSSRRGAPDGTRPPAFYHQLHQAPCLLDPRPSLVTCCQHSRCSLKVTKWTCHPCSADKQVLGCFLEQRRLENRGGHGEKALPAVNRPPQAVLSHDEQNIY